MTRFETAAASNPEIAGACARGLEALKGEHRRLVQAREPRQLTCSLDLDGRLSRMSRHARSSRWDYGIGYKQGRVEHVVWMEVHRAHTGEVPTVLAKLAWLKKWLREECPALEKLPNPMGFVWIATESGVHITPRSRQARQLAAAGISQPARILRLP